MTTITKFAVFLLDFENTFVFIWKGEVCVQRDISGIWINSHVFKFFLDYNEDSVKNIGINILNFCLFHRQNLCGFIT